MVFLLIIIVLFSIILSFFVLLKTKDISNPPLLITFFFCFPLIFNQMKFSGLQSNNWDFLTYLNIIYFVISFSVIPSLLLLTGKFNKKNFDYSGIFELRMNNVIIILFLAIILQIVLNKLNCGYFIPSLNIEKLQGVIYHTINVSFWGLFIEMFWLFAIIVGVINVFYKKNKMLLILLILCFLTPLLTRFARMIVFTSIMTIFFIFNDIVLKRRRFYIYTLIAGIVFILIGMLLMVYRGTHGGKFKFSISHEIKYNGPFKGETIATAYAYFSLPFENIDRFVKKNKKTLDYNYGAYTLRPITVTLLKAPYFFPNYPNMEHFNKLNDPVSRSSNVPTAVPLFSLDFGFIFSFIPMLFYSFLGLFLFIYGRKYVILRVLYFTFTTCYILSAFQNLFIEGNYIYIFLFLIVFEIFKKRTLILSLY